MIYLRGRYVPKLMNFGSEKLCVHFCSVKMGGITLHTTYLPKCKKPHVVLSSVTEIASCETWVSGKRMVVWNGTINDSVASKFGTHYHDVFIN